MSVQLPYMAILQQLPSIAMTTQGYIFLPYMGLNQPHIQALPLLPGYKARSECGFKCCRVCISVVTGLDDVQYAENSTRDAEVAIAMYTLAHA